MTDDEFRATVKFLLLHLKILVEPSGAAAAAAVLHKKLPPGIGSMGVVLSGGNVDFEELVKYRKVGGGYETTNIFGTIGAASAASAASKPGAEMGEDYYDKLGVTKIINAAGTYTALTASIMPPPVQAAVALAAKLPCGFRTCRRRLESISRRS